MRFPQSVSVEADASYRVAATDGLSEGATRRGIMPQDACVCAGCIKGAMVCKCCTWKGCKTKIKPC